MDFLLRYYLTFTQLRANALKTKLLDLSSITWFYPTVLLPLGIFIKKNPDIYVNPPKKQDVLTYFNIITEKHEIDVNKSYIPIIKIPKSKTEQENALKQLNKFDLYSVGGGRSTFMYFINEFVDNIEQHSNFSTGYIMAQMYKSKGYIDVCIIDDGISIPQSFENAEIEVKNDNEAINSALHGVSTKKEKDRGEGLHSSVNLLTKGLKGTCLIVSRRGALLANQTNKEFYNIENEHIYNGTLVSTHIPFQEGRVNLYDYIEGRKNTVPCKSDFK